MERNASCACGQLSLRLDGDPQMQGVCHCTNCKRRTGSAFGISAYFPKSALVRTTGESSVYAFQHVARNHEQRRHFCPTCGTTVFWFISTLPDLIGVAGGCFADAGLPAPGHSVAHRNREDWVRLPESWKTHDD